MTLHARHILILGALTLALCGGCAADSGGSPGIVPACTSDSDCGVGEVCIEGYCSVEQNESVQLDLRFFPPQDSAYRPQQITNVGIDSERRLNFGLRSAVNVGDGDDEEGSSPGGVLFEGEESADGPTGTLIFSRNDIQDSRFDAQVRVTEGDFDALLHPATYDVTFVPDRDAPAQELLPQKTWRGLTFETSRKWTGRVPSGESLRRIDGFVRREVTTSGATELVEGASVYATTPDGTLVSAPTVTDSDGGFTLYVQPELGPYDVHVGPSFSNLMVPKATFPESFEPIAGGCLDAEGNTVVCPDLSLDLGTYVEAPKEYDLRLVPGDIDWTGTRVTITAESFGVGSFERKVTVEPSGTATISLFPNKYYRFEIVPPTNLRYARSEFEIFIDPDDNELPNSGDFELEPKQRVQGVVVDATGQPVPLERIEFAPDQAAVASASEDIDGRPVSTQTDESGEFEVFLEGIDHLAYVRPNQRSGLPITRRKLAASAIRTGSFAEIRLAQPRVVLGGVFSSSGMGGPLPDVVVRAYERADGELRVVGEAQSDSGSTRGNFRMVISSELE